MKNSKRIPQETLNKLNDKELLQNLHVEQLWSITYMSKQFKVTYETVRKALKKFNIESPTQQQLREASNLRKYGVSNPGAVKEFHQKAVDTMVERYGGHVWSHSGKREQRDQTCKKKYGVANVGKTQHAKDKAKETNLTKYGRVHKNQTHLPEETLKLLSDKNWLAEQHLTEKRSMLSLANELRVNDSTIKNALIKAGITPQIYNSPLSKETYDLLTSKEWMYDQHVVQQKSCSQIAYELNVDPYTVQRRMSWVGVEMQQLNRSFGENQVANFAKSICDEVVCNTRKIINPKELDIYFPNLNIAIEYCGVFWHSEKNGKQQNFHKTKMLLCKEKGINLLTLFESEWLENPEGVRSLINFFISADRNKNVSCNYTIKPITSMEVQQFIKRNSPFDLQETTINYGLFRDNECTEIMCFEEQEDNEFVLQHYLSTNNFITNNFESLLNHFKLNHVWSKIVVYSDLRWSFETIYETNQFELAEIVEPAFYYVKQLRIYPSHYTNIKSLLKNYDPNLSEQENCKNDGIDRIWDCGKKKYVLQNLS